jgi:hypothetical protein
MPKENHHTCIIVSPVYFHISGGPIKVYRVGKKCISLTLFPI